MDFNIMQKGRVINIFLMMKMEKLLLIQKVNIMKMERK